MAGRKKYPSGKNEKREPEFARLADVGAGAVADRARENIALRKSFPSRARANRFNIAYRFARLRQASL